MRSELFWDIRQRIVITPYGRFGTPVGPSFFDFFTLADGTDKLSRNVGKEYILYAA
jgi:hypothetical protein